MNQKTIFYLMASSNERKTSLGVELNGVGLDFGLRAPSHASRQCSRRRATGRVLGALIVATLFLLGSVRVVLAAETSGPRTFDSPQQALAALAAAVSGRDLDALRAIFGPDVQELVNPDRVQATNEFAAFAEAMEQSRRLVSKTTNSFVVEVGENSYPFAVPIVQKDRRWLVDAEAGKEEMIDRRIGRNELGALLVIRAYVEAQREYASRDRDGDEVLEYAQKLISSPGQKDGLYWPLELDGERSPLGPLVAFAREEGYKRTTAADSAATAEPFHGYFYRILTHQGSHAPGGQYNYVINGNMIAGFALVAFPAEYDVTGVMTFIVNQQGKVYQKDLGKDTSKVAMAMDEYDPDSSWKLSLD
jgi:hypothetical protein